MVHDCYHRLQGLRTRLDACLLWDSTLLFPSYSFRCEKAEAGRIPVYCTIQFSSVQFSSFAQSCPTLCDLMNRSTPGLPVHHHSLSSLRLTSIESVMPSSHLILCRPLLLLPSIFPSITVFSNESSLRIRWPKYWTFSFNISPSNEQLGSS